MISRRIVQAFVSSEAIAIAARRSGLYKANHIGRSSTLHCRRVYTVEHPMHLPVYSVRSSPVVWESKAATFKSRTTGIRALVGIGSMKAQTLVACHPPYDLTGPQSVRFTLQTYCLRHVFINSGEQEVL